MLGYSPRNEILWGGTRLPFPGASYGSDFTVGRHQMGRRRYSNPADLPGWTFTRASTGYAETAAGALVAFASGAPRITDKGILVEEARTNLALRSQEFDNATWVKTNFTVTANAAAAPDGTTTADLITATSTAATIIQGSITVAATAATYTVYVKKGSQNTTATGSFLLRNVTTATILVNCVLSWATMTVSGTGASISAMADGWYRLTLTTSTGITSGDTISIYPGASGGAITVGDNWYLWGAQLEAATFPTSYIPTTTASATRAADVATLTYVPTFPVTMVCNLKRAGGLAALRTFMMLDDGTVNERAILRINASNNVEARQTTGGVDVATVTTATALSALNTQYKIAGRFALNNVNAAASGAAGTADTTAAVPVSPTTLRLGHLLGGTEAVNAYIEQAILYQVNDSDAALAARTA